MGKGKKRTDKMTRAVIPGAFWLTDLLLTEKSLQATVKPLEMCRRPTHTADNSSSSWPTHGNTRKRGSVYEREGGCAGEAVGGLG